MNRAMDNQVPVVATPMQRVMVHMSYLDAANVQVATEQVCEHAVELAMERLPTSVYQMDADCDAQIMLRLARLSALRRRAKLHTVYSSRHAWQQRMAICSWT